MALLTVAFSSPSLAQDELGMTVTGDESNALGLFISRWMDGRGSDLPAPALQQEAPEPLDPDVLRRQLELRRAAKRPSPESGS